MNFLLKLVLTAAAALGLSYVLPGVHFGGIGTAIWFVLMLGVMNAIVKPILKLISFPITILTLGLFTLVINVIVIQLADLLTPDDNVRGFIWSLLFAFGLSVITTVIDKMFDRDNKATA
ncbi:MAG: phage holin family protein [Hymenobacteraceae bacterium]|nr:phage holin family protein [Hymenobacteraceae bacterium]